MNRNPLARIASILIVVAAAFTVGCGTGRSSHHHHNPDGSYSYYRFHQNHTKQCSCRNVYHPSSHYYHAHY